MKLYIKNMVCPRCITAVDRILRTEGIAGHVVALGEVETDNELTHEQREAFARSLDAEGFELLIEESNKIVAQIKSLIINLVYQQNAQLDGPLSAYITDAIHQDYSSVSTIFHNVYGQTIERYFISVKIERVKELMFYDEMSLKEIAYLLNYSSVAHLSTQFKRETGLTPSAFKNNGKRHKGLDKV